MKQSEERDKLEHPEKDIKKGYKRSVRLKLQLYQKKYSL